MKINEQEKAQTRQRILQAAVDVITAKGFKSASMREIAQQAKVGDATIYNYFPSKEKLLYGYCEHIQQTVMDGLKAIPDFNEYSLAEQLQQLIESELQAWLPAREFLQEVFRLTFYSPVAAREHLEAARSLNCRMVVDLIDAAIEAGEIPAQPYHELLPRLFWDYQTGILAYWLKDDSAGFAHTTQLVDRSMEIVAGVLQNGLIGKSLDLLSFLFRTHVMSHVESWGEVRKTLAVSKRRFMTGSDEK
ncbi:MAG: TetR/AcrR family transcriptional regulator [Azonexus sp.]